MIVALAAVAALEVPARDALAQRWLHANRAHHAAQLASAGSAPSPPSDLAALAQRELSIAGRYQLHERVVPAPPEGWWSRFLDWLGERWDALKRALFSHLRGADRTVTGIGDVLLIAIGLVLLGAIVSLLRNIRLARSGARTASQPLATPADPRALYDEACAAAAAGEHGIAALRLFAATIALLDLHRVVHGRRSATVGDVRRELRANDAQLIEPFDAIAAPFVRSAYAQQPVSAGDWERARDAFAGLPQAQAPL